MELFRLFSGFLLYSSLAKMPFCKTACNIEIIFYLFFRSLLTLPAFRNVFTWPKYLIKTIICIIYIIYIIYIWFWFFHFYFNFSFRRLLIKWKPFFELNGIVIFYLLIQHVFLLFHFLFIIVISRNFLKHWNILQVIYIFQWSKSWSNIHYFLLTVLLLTNFPF